MDKISAVDIFLKNFLSSADEALAEEINEISVTKNIHAKSPLFLNGDKADSMYYLISGVIKLSRVSMEGKESVIRFVYPNELFAEIVVNGADTYPVDAVALEDSQVLGLSIHLVRQMSIKDPDFMMKLFASMAVRLRYLVDMVDSKTSENSSDRLLSYLKKLADMSGRNEVRLPVAKGELALLLGTTPETVSRMFSKLKADGVISEEKNLIKLL